MSESRFDDLPAKASPEVIAERNRLANEVCQQLAQAGLPAYRADLSDGGADVIPGAAVHIEPFIEGGVFVDWETGEDLRDEALALFAQGIDFANPPGVVRHHTQVLNCMRTALMGILASAGFDVEEPDRHGHGSMVHVKHRHA
ncbi:hypothetical protein [Streptomyces fumanus]|uniref:Uncharacterized protein n=1 Tax=Streptomyces fumanus TaxID=67302 RepID=A0A919ACI8_9ACTN|nr:hypothetical protein [Streptomyces fumanus]GHE98849.1 hypothetical protein GCM10018772_24190 [Streptomyces fumanus]